MVSTWPVPFAIHRAYTTAFELLQILIWKAEQCADHQSPSRGTAERGQLAAHGWSVWPAGAWSALFLQAPHIGSCRSMRVRAQLCKTKLHAAPAGVTAPM